MAPMAGSRIHTRLPWSQCHCGCQAGSKSRKAERRLDKRGRQKTLARKQIEEDRS